MKVFKNITAITLLCLVLFSANSCVILTPSRHDNGKHKGWYKNKNHSKDFPKLPKKSKKDHHNQ